jgi:LacI family transcriptional regulator
MPRVKARLVDVARDAGVSPATVSRALTQPELLSFDTLTRVRHSARRLGYRPDGMARALASGRSMTIGAVVPTLDSTIFARFLQSMQSALARESYQLLVASHEMNGIAETEAIRTLIARGVDGLVLVGASRPVEAQALLQSSGVPVVLTWCSRPEFAAVSVDNEKAGYLAASHLASVGHRVIGAIVGHLTYNDRQSARLAGARHALKKVGLELPDSYLTQQPLTLAGGRAGTAALLDLAQPPTAIVGGVDLFAIGAIQEAQVRGLSVPLQFSVVGIDDIDMSAHMTPSVTTVHIPTARIGHDAAEIIISEINGSTQRMQRALPVELVVRKSVGPLSPQ